MQGQQTAREEVQGVGLALLVASTLHAIATGNLLPPRSRRSVSM